MSTWEPEGLGLTGDNPTLTGTLEGLDGCLVIRANEENAGAIYVPVFDLGASNLDSALLEVGTTVQLKGAWVSPSTELSVPNACAGQGRLWRVARA
ncbi:hypothetical protein [uncultured Pseudokineococcus sp.]|uniref:hypothetical protein n=1 Tax=uncultured Pseudokineococcus sp. TaxID=1642928 RepID=UPI0026028B16|nr:hypothetical protein [uncultured Pseudokineococcus sp.]